MSKLLLIPVFAFYINFCNFGFMRSGGVLYMAFIRQFNCTYAQASWPTVLIGSFASFTIAVAGFLSHYVEKRTIILAGILLNSLAIGLTATVQSIEWIIVLSAVQGIGVGMFVGLIPIIISEYFDQGRSTACGVSYAGCTLASFVFPIFLQSMLDRFDLRIALAALSMISFSSLITAWPFESRPVKLVEDGEDGEEAQPENRNLVQQLRKDLDVLRLPSFWIVSVFYVVFIYVFLIFIIVLPDLAVERGLRRQSAAFLLSIHSIGDFAGRILPGYLHYTNIVRNQTFYLYSMLAMAGLFLLIELYAISFLTFSLFCVAIGFVTGTQMTLPAVVMVELIGVERTTIGFGFSNVLSGLIALTRPSLIDYVKRSNDSYDQLLIICAMLCALAAVPWCLHSALGYRKRAVDEQTAVLSAN